MDVLVNVYFIEPITNEVALSSWYTYREDCYSTLDEFKKQYGGYVNGEIVGVSYIEGNNINYI